MTEEKNKIKIALIASPVGFKGGTFRHLLNWCRFFDQRKIEIALFCSWASEEDKAQADSFFKEIEGIQYFSNNWLHPISNWLKFGISEISNALNHFKPDVIHTIFIQPDILMSILSARIGSPAHVSSWEGALVGKKFHSKLGQALYSIAYKFMQNKISAVISISDATAKENCVDYDVPISKVKTIHSGLDLSKFGNIKSEFSEAPVVGLVSRLTAEKEVELFVRAIPEVLQTHPNTRFEIIGDGPDRSKLESLAKELELTSNLTFKGWCQNVSEVLPTLDIFVFTSSGEGLPWCILEAQASGVPLIASSVGGIPEVITNNSNGLLAETNSPECFASCIKKLLSNPKLAMEMAQNGRKKIENHFTIQREVSDITNLYLKLINKSQT